MLGYAMMGKAHSRAFLAQRTLGTPLQPELVSITGRDAENGYRCAEVCDAIVRSSASGAREEIVYEGSAV
jgi:hypothetical protein